MPLPTIVGRGVGWICTPRIVPNMERTKKGRKSDKLYRRHVEEWPNVKLIISGNLNTWFLFVVGDNDLDESYTRYPPLKGSQRFSSFFAFSRSGGRVRRFTSGLSKLLTLTILGVFRGFIHFVYTSPAKNQDVWMQGGYLSIPKIFQESIQGVNEISCQTNQSNRKNGYSCRSIGRYNTVFFLRTSHPSRIFIILFVRF